METLSEIGYEVINYNYDQQFEYEIFSYNNIMCIFSIIENHLPDGNKFIFTLSKYSSFSNKIILTIGEFKYKKKNFNLSYFSNFVEISFQISKYDKCKYSINKLNDNYYLILVTTCNFVNGYATYNYKYYKCDDLYGVEEWFKAKLNQ